MSLLQIYPTLDVLAARQTRFILPVILDMGSSNSGGGNTVHDFQDHTSFSAAEGFATNEEDEEVSN